MIRVSIDDLAAINHQLNWILLRVVGVFNYEFIDEPVELTPPLSRPDRPVRPAAKLSFMLG